MLREELTLLGFAAFAVLILLYFLSSIVGVVLTLGIGCGLGMLTEHFYPSPFRNGRLSATAVGLAGSLVGGWILGKWGPSLGGIFLVPTLLGALAVSAGLRAYVWYRRVKKLEEFKALGSGDPLLNSRLAQYRLIRFLGSGTFSRVYQAVPEKTLREDESVAIKVFKDSAVEEDDFVERMKREVQACQALQHPYIVRSFEAAQEGDLSYLVLEYVQGTPLSKRMQNGVFELEVSQEILAQIAEALVHAHSKGVVHRDIKPENIVMTTKGVKIMDFGLARIQGQATLTQTGSAMGTPHYMSPEQVLDPKNIDGRCDQYALGCVAFEMFTGERVFQGDQPVIVVTKHAQEAPRNPRELNPKLPPELAEMVLKMLAKKPEQRYPGLQDVVEILRA
jgi:serine/threonine protein kinase/uncharacterized membrane protein YeaQ/YmgE (transglycosylase-associated protein family)